MRKALRKREPYQLIKKKDLGSLKQTLPPSLLESSGVSTQMLEGERV
jgi:hypothetical protein